MVGNRCDIDFPIRFDFTKYAASGKNSNNNYILKSCISYKPDNGKYFADININPENDLGKWIRYMDNQIRELNSFRGIYDFEPQILIYEQKNRIQGNNNDNANNNNNNNNGNTNPQFSFWRRSTGYNDISLNNALQNNNNNNNSNNNNNLNNPNNMGFGFNNANNNNQNNANNIFNANNFMADFWFQNHNNNGNNQNNGN